MNEKRDVSKLDTSLFSACVFCQFVVSSSRARRAGPTPKGGTPMSALEVIALLTLVIAAVSLGYQIKK
mgnify:CR=1 FL=1